MTDKFALEETQRIRNDWAQRGRYWDKRADELADMAALFNSPLLDAVGLAPEQMVLDCATGAGEPALTAAKLIAPGRLMATDLVWEMLAGARRRVRQAGIGNVDFQLADMTALPFLDNWFDRVICRFGIMFVPYPERAAAEALRVLKPGGRAGYMVWGPRAHNIGFDAVARAVERVFGPDDPLVDFTTPFKLADDGAATRALAAAGFENIVEQDVYFSPKIPASERFWDVQLDMGLGGRLQTATENQREELETLIVENLSSHIKNSQYNLELHIKTVIGNKPS